MSSLDLRLRLALDFDALAPGQLSAISGGFPGTGMRPGPRPRPEPRTWSEDLSRKRGQMRGEPRIREIDPPDPDMDRGIERRWDGFAPPPSSGDARW